MSRTTRAFTIIELLVVIAVIGVLSSILLPAVSNVRRTAARTQDQSNQRQLVGGHQLCRHPQGPDHEWQHPASGLLRFRAGQSNL